MRPPWYPYLPGELAGELLASPGTDPRERVTLSDFAVLFADVSGFTVMSEALAKAGREGAEELSDVLNRYFEAMIPLVHARGGVVSSFGGDAMTVLFPEGSGRAEAVRAAVDCARAMQEAMRGFEAVPTSAGAFRLGMKAGVAEGAVLRMVVGDPALRLQPVYAGPALDAAAEAEHHAERGQIILREDLLPLVPEVRRFERLEGHARLDEVVPADLSMAPTPRAEGGDHPLGLMFLHPVVARWEAEGRGRLLNEHRRATVLFVRYGDEDIFDPEAPARLQATLAEAIAVVRAHGGSVNKIDMGDKGSKLIAVFGAPLAHEDDAFRGLLCALELQRRRPVAVGVATGAVYVGAVGSAARKEYAVMGLTVALAARLMQAAGAPEAATILCDPPTFAAVGDRFEVEALPPRQLKGTSAPMVLRRVLRARPHRYRPPRVEGALVGRVAERAALLAALDRAGAGEGGLVLVEGEAGVGKSRLLAEAVAEAERRGFTVVGGACPAWSVGRPCPLWRDVVDTLLGLPEGAPPEAAVALAREALGPALADRLPLLASLMEVEIPDTPLTASLSPAQRRASLHDLVCTLARQAAAQAPVLVVLEDLQGLDEPARALLDALGTWLRYERVLLLGAARGGVAVSAAEHLVLGPLDEADTTALVQRGWAERFEGEPDAEVVVRVVARAQGNPLFAEQLLDALAARGEPPTAAAALELPDTLRALVSSRLDALAGERRLAAQLASVVGLRFRGDWVRAGFGALGGDWVGAALEDLAGARVTVPEDGASPPAWRFRQALVQEVAYERQALATRRGLHGSLGAWLADQDEVPPDLVAHHLSLGDAPERDRGWFLRAAEHAERAWAPHVAIAWLERWLEVGDPDDRDAVLLRVGVLRLGLGDVHGAQRCFVEGLQLADQQGDHRTGRRARICIAQLLLQQGLAVQAGPWVAAAMAAAHAAGDQVELAETHRLAWTVAWAQGQYAQALAHADAELALARVLDDAKREARALGAAGNLRAQLGQHEQAQALMEAAAARLQELGDLAGLVVVAGNLGVLAFSRQRWLEAARWMGLNASVAAQIGDARSAAIALGNQGAVLACSGAVDVGVACLAGAIDRLLALQDRRGVVMDTAALAEAVSWRGQRPLARRLLDVALGLARALRMGGYLPAWLVLAGRLALEDGEAEQALALAREAAALPPGDAFHDHPRLLELDAERALGHRSGAQVLAALDALSLPPDLAPALAAARALAAPEREDLRLAALAALREPTATAWWSALHERLGGGPLQQTPLVGLLPDDVEPEPDLERVLARVAALAPAAAVG